MYGYVPLSRPLINFDVPRLRTVTVVEFRLSPYLSPRRSGFRLAGRAIRPTRLTPSIPFMFEYNSFTHKTATIE